MHEGRSSLNRRRDLYSVTILFNLNEIECSCYKIYITLSVISNFNVSSYMEFLKIYWDFLHSNINTLLLMDKEVFNVSIHFSNLASVFARSIYVIYLWYWYKVVWSEGVMSMEGGGETCIDLRKMSAKQIYEETIQPRRLLSSDPSN